MRCRRDAGRALGAGAIALVLVSAGLLGSPGRAAHASAAGALPAPEPDLSLPAVPRNLSQGGSSFVMLGADTSGEAFGYTEEQGSHPALARVGASAVPKVWNGPGASNFVIYGGSASGGWHITQEALDATGQPLSDFAPFGYNVGGNVAPAGDVAPGGSGVIAGTATVGGQPRTQVLLVRGPGGAFQAAPSPSAALLPAPETLFDAHAPALAAIDDSGHGGVLIAPASGQLFVPPPAEVLHFDGTAWSAEPLLTAAPGQSGSQPASIDAVMAISATAPGNAYLLAQDANPAVGVELFEREGVGHGTPYWVPVSLTGAEGALYAQAAGSVPGGGTYTGLGPLYPEGTTELVSHVPRAKSLAAAGAQPLTATASGAWVDGAFTDASGSLQQFTLDVAVSPAAPGPQGAVTAWCTTAPGPMCDHTVAALPDGYYSSIAFPGAGPNGQRVITGLSGGSILSLQGTSFDEIAGLGPEPTDDGSAAFLSPTEGWTGGAPPVHFTLAPGADQLQAWPTPFRQPLTAIAAQPGSVPGAVSAQAIAVGENGEVARYIPGQGWTAESLLTPAGVIATPTLRAVAWPQSEFAYAVGDNGNMWRWDSATGLWQRDPATPLGFLGNLTGIAFDSANPDRGYAVGLDGVLLEYGKTWTQDPLPAGLQNANFTSVTFAGSEAIAAFQTAQPPAASGTPSTGVQSGLLVNDGSGWQLDTQEGTLVTPASGAQPVPTPAVSIVAGLPDGGAVAAGDGVLIERDSATAPWRLARDPLPGYSVVAAAAIRSGASVQALLSIDPEDPAGAWPNPSPVAAPTCTQSSTCVGDQGLPTIYPPYDLPANGWLLRETATGWQDVQRNAFPALTGLSGPVDNPTRDDEVQALLIDPASGTGWAVGGEAGIAPTGGLASSSANSALLHTGGIYRYPAATTPPNGAATSPPSLDTGQITVALAGGASCLSACASRNARIGLGPPTWLVHALRTVSDLSSQPGGPKAFVYTGGVVPAAMQTLAPSDPQVTQAVSAFAATASAAAGSLPFAPVVSPDEILGSPPTPASALAGAFAAPPGVRGAFPDYYDFDLATQGVGTLRVIVIDDATPSEAQALAAGDTTDAQYTFLTGELASARAAHIPAIVVGSRTLSTASVTGDAAPAGAAAIAGRLVADGASAYFFESPNSNAQYQIPTGAAQTIPSFGTGSLGYAAFASSGNAFGESGYLLASVDVAHADPLSDRAPVTVRLIPNISELAIDAMDGTLLQRSQVAMFTALARRPSAGTGQAQAGALVGPDPYIAIPPAPCSFACAARIDPEFTFTSSRPDIGGFVEHDPASANPRAVYLGANAKPVPDSSSGLFCAYNAGQTTVTVTTGGLSFSETVTVLGGQIRYPCGTTPLKNPPPKYVTSGASPPPSPAPLPPLPIKLTPAPPPPPPAPAPVPVLAAHPAATPPVHHAVPAPTPTPAPIFVVPPPPAPAAPPVIVNVPTPPASPSLPTGFSAVPVPITQPVGATQEKREEEHAVEHAQNFSAYTPGEPGTSILSPALAVGLIVILAGAGATLRRRPGRRPAPAFVAVEDPHRRGSVRGRGR